MHAVFVATSRFTVANDMTEPVKAAFRERPRLVDEAPGFLRMDVISPEDAPDEIWLITYWADRRSFETWHASPAHRLSHAFMPPGLKLVPGRTEVRHFEYVSD